MAKQPRHHHYVPQFYLAKFSSTGNSNGTLHVLDLKEKRQWQSKPESTGHARDYHVVDLGADRDPMFVEKKLAEREGKWATVLRSVFSLSITISPGSRPSLGRLGARTQISPIPARTSPTMTNIQPKPLFPSAPFIYAFLAETSTP